MQRVDRRAPCIGAGGRGRAAHGRRQDAATATGRAVRGGAASSGVTQDHADLEGSRMTIRLTLLCAHRPATSTEAVLGDTSLTERDLPEAGAALAALPPHFSAVRSPSTRCAFTAAFLGLKPAVEPALRDLDHGTWRGRRPAEIVATDPYGYSAWLTDPDAAPHGGETVRRLCARTGDWLGSLTSQTGRVLAVVEPTVARALIVQALSAPVRTFWNLQTPPRRTVSLMWRDGVWSVGTPTAVVYRSDADLGPYGAWWREPRPDRFTALVGQRGTGAVVGG
ncbi:MULTISPECIES: histidine phosphatase family protein [Streptomyces]|nr:MULTISPECIES: histidine phosphatase family protein [Streptomyces]